MTNTITRLGTKLNLVKAKLQGLSLDQRIRLLNTYEADPHLQDIYGIFKQITWEMLQKDYKTKISIDNHNITYTNILEDTEGWYSAGVFFIPKHYNLPLHDHTNMLVYSKTLYGDVEVETIEGKHSEKDLLEIEKVNIIKLKCNETSVLTPNRNNIHKVTAMQNSAFFDILIPNYTTANECCYYDIVTHGSKKYIKKVKY
jgi:hypothetical protein